MNDLSPTATPSFTARGVVAGLRSLGPVAFIFALPFGIAFGAAALDRGLSPDQALLMSGIMFAGASQFAALEVWRDPPPYLTIALVVLAVNARHVILGAALAPWVNPLPRGRRFAALVLLSDANFADSRKAFSQGAVDAGRILGGGLALWSAWMVGVAIGVAIGARAEDLDKFGVDLVMASFFAAIVAVAAYPVPPAGWNIIVAALCGGAVGAARHGR